MNTYRNIVESVTEPDVHDLWLKSDGIYKFGANGWEPLYNIKKPVKTQDSFSYLMSLCASRAQELRDEAATASYPAVCIVNMMRFEGNIDAEHQVDMNHFKISSLTSSNNSIENLDAINALPYISLSTKGSFFISTQGEETTTTCFVSNAILPQSAGFNLMFYDFDIVRAKDYDVFPITVNAPGMFVSCCGLEQGIDTANLGIGLDLKIINDGENQKIPIVNIVAVKKSE